MMYIKTNLAIFAIVAVTLMLVTAAAITTTFAGPALAVKHTTKGKHGTSGVTSTTAKKGTNTSTSSHHIKGIKLLHIHTKPSPVTVGSTFSIRATLINNSSNTISFTNGTCTSPFSTKFDKNVVVAHQTSSCKAPSQKVVVRPGQNVPITGPNLSGIVYRASAAGPTNATITFNYGIENGAGTGVKSHTSDSIMRIFMINIQPSAQTGPSAAPSPSG